MFGFCMVARRISPNRVAAQQRQHASSAAAAAAMITTLYRLAP